ncbi:MAG: heat shock protein Hsp20 [Deltaproteobacteria bacterium]|nr:heat shock protein Hsp20 [Deltaproteobacteria bacterium]
MPLTPWRSVWDTRFPSLREEMDRVFEDFFGDTGFAPLSKTDWLPPVDIVDTAKDITVIMDIPAIDPDKVAVTVLEDTLTIEGERKQEQEFKDRDYYRSERIHGFFSRTIALPDNVIGEKASASYKDGVLTIKMPKSHKELAKEIKINVENARPAKIAAQTAKQRRK